MLNCINFLHGRQNMTSQNAMGDKTPLETSETLSVALSWLSHKFVFFHQSHTFIPFHLSHYFIWSQVLPHSFCVEMVFPVISSVMWKFRINIFPSNIILLYSHICFLFRMVSSQQ